MASLQLSSPLPSLPSPTTTRTLSSLSPRSLADKSDLTTVPLRLLLRLAPRSSPLPRRAEVTSRHLFLLPNHPRSPSYQVAPGVSRLPPLSTRAFVPTPVTRCNNNTRNSNRTVCTANNRTNRQTSTATVPLPPQLPTPSRRPSPRLLPTRFASAETTTRPRHLLDLVSVNSEVGPTRVASVEPRPLHLLPRRVTMRRRVGEPPERGCAKLLRLVSGRTQNVKEGRACEEVNRGEGAWMGNRVVGSG